MSPNPINVVSNLVTCTSKIVSRQKRYQGTSKGKEAYRKATGKYWTKKYLETEYGITLEELDRIIQNYQTFITELVPR